MITSRRARFFVSHDAVTGNRAVLRGAERHHFRVRRIRVGTCVELFDDEGREFDAVVDTLTDDHVELSVRERAVRPRESPLDLTLAVALLKADKLDLVVEKVTELGATRIVLFTCAHSLGSGSTRRLERWQRIALSAAKQCGRSRVPVIEGPEPIDAVAIRAAGLRLLCWEHAAETRLPDRSAVSSVLIAIGPEGGFADEEITLLRQSGFDAISLGPRILRAETAAIAAIVLAQQRWGDA